MIDQNKIIRDLADRECKRISTSIIRRLQKMKGNSMLSGDDSELGNTWDEICVQVQGDRSFFWDAYEQTIEQMLHSAVESLTQETETAIWLQTENGYVWDEEEDGEPETVFEDVANYILHEYIYEEASRWNNYRIEAHMERESRAGMED